MSDKIPRLGRPPKDRRRFIRVAAAVDYRGDDDAQLCFLFRGAPISLVADAFRFLVADGKGIAKAVEVRSEHDALRRMGKGFWRIVAEVREPDLFFCSIHDMQLLIASWFRRHHPCSVAWMPIDRFLNA